MPDCSESLFYTPCSEFNCLLKTLLWPKYVLKIPYPKTLHTHFSTVTIRADSFAIPGIKNY